MLMTMPAHQVRKMYFLKRQKCSHTLSPFLAGMVLRHNSEYPEGKCISVAGRPVEQSDPLKPHLSLGKLTPTFDETRNL